MVLRIAVVRGQQHAVRTESHPAPVAQRQLDMLYRWSTSQTHQVQSTKTNTHTEYENTSSVTARILWQHQ